MFERMMFYIELRRYRSFSLWLKATTSGDMLGRLITEATQSDLIRPYNPFDDSFVGTGLSFEDRVKMIYKRFESDIWDSCLGAGKYGEDGHYGLECLARLPLQMQVHDPNTFLEFMVRNAIAHTALQILSNKGGRDSNYETQRKTGKK